MNGRFRSSGRTDPGLVRKNNEDAFLVLPGQGLYAVADGMGGVAGGEYASHTALDILERAAGLFEPATTLEERLAVLHNAVDEASRDIRQWAERQGVTGSGTTIVMLCLDPRRADRAVALHAGDSRIYMLRNGHLQPVTKDHSVAESFANGKDEDVPALFRNVITNAIGLADKVRLEETSVTLYRGDILLICSDGLYRMVPDDRIREILARSVSLDDRADALIQAARDGGGKDNITVVLLEAEADAGLDDGSEAETQDTDMRSAREAAEFRRSPEHPRSTEDSEIVGRSFSDTSTRERPPAAAAPAAATPDQPAGKRKSPARWIAVGAVAVVALVAAGLMLGGGNDEEPLPETRPPAAPSPESAAESAAPAPEPEPPPATLWDLYGEAERTGAWGVWMDRASTMGEDAVRGELGDDKAALGRAWHTEWLKGRQRPDEAKAELMMMADDLRRTLAQWTDDTLVPEVTGWSDRRDEAANRYAKMRMTYQQILFREVEAYIGETMLVLAAFGQKLDDAEAVLQKHAIGFAPRGASLAARRSEIAALAQSLNRWVDNTRGMPIGVPELRNLNDTLLRPVENGLEDLFASLGGYLEAVPGLAINPDQNAAARDLLTAVEGFVNDLRNGRHTTSAGRAAMAGEVRKVLSAQAWAEVDQGGL